MGLTACTHEEPAPAPTGSSTVSSAPPRGSLAKLSGRATSACYQASTSHTPTAVALHLTVPDGDDALTILAIDGAEETAPDASVVLPADSSHPASAEYLPWADLAEMHPSQWAERRPAIGATLQPGSDTLLAIPHTLEAGDGQSRTWAGPTLRYRQGGHTFTVRGRTKLTITRGTCPQG